MPAVPQLIKISNQVASVLVDPLGGAITAFQLKSIPVNPLSFAFTPGQMPPNNKAGAVYQGHFMCCGRWGEPAPGELKAGMPNHGQTANIPWTVLESDDNRVLMESIAEKEGLKVNRSLYLDENSTAMKVSEAITNINSLGRFFNVVQHPTIAAPFLDSETIVNCNATEGFDQSNYHHISNNIIHWPLVAGSGNTKFDLQKSSVPSNGVFSFIVNPAQVYGWVTAYSPVHHLLLGYIWNRSDYPWINLWLHYNNGTIAYRGLEFGTTGIHQPFNIIADTATSVFGEKTMAFIDAGECVSKSYIAFLHRTENSFTGVEDIRLKDDCVAILTSGSNEEIFINSSKKISNGLQK